MVTLCLLLAFAAPDAPFVPDEHTVLLYHFDESEGDLARDESGHGQDGQLLGPRRVAGRFGGAIRLDGRDDSVFRQDLPALRDMRQATVECWFRQEAATGRRFVVGLDVGFHFEVDEGSYASLSIYNQGGAVANAEGRPHQQIAAEIGLLRSGWRHLAATYDGNEVSFFLDGVLRARLDAANDFALGAECRGLWVGSYVGTDYWFAGTIDEVRVSDVVRYDPEKSLAVGGRAFELATSEERLSTDRSVRVPARTGEASLELTLRKLHGGHASGNVFLKAPDAPARVVGTYDLEAAASGEERAFAFDVSDEATAPGTYLVALEPTDASGYLSLVSASLRSGGATVAEWAGDARSRRTGSPVVLASLTVGDEARPDTGWLLPAWLPDRATGELTADRSDPSGIPSVAGNGRLEWWLDAPTAGWYEVWARYASGGNRPCDLVVDGEDLHDFNMCLRSATVGYGAAEALWERQGTVWLAEGPHWIRLQDVLPDVVALALVPGSSAASRRVPWGRHPVPAEGAWRLGGEWQVAPSLGDSSATLSPSADGVAWRARFGNTDPSRLLAGDVVRLIAPVRSDLEPFGRLRARWEGTGSGHVVSLRLVDAKGDEKLLWRVRDLDAGPQELAIPLSFEGNDVFDPGRVVALVVELDEGGAQPTEASESTGSLSGFALQRRDTLREPESYRARLEAALATVDDAQTPRAGLAPPAFRPWTRPVVPEDHVAFAASDPKPVTRATLGYRLHFTGARDIAPGALEDFHTHYDFGDISWPHIGICPLRSDYPSDEEWRRALGGFEEQLEAVRDRGLILWDIWGYVPNGEAGPTPTLVGEHREVLDRVFGDRFLGVDNGEQDGRYIGGFSDGGAFTDRQGGWEDFVRWDEGICRDSLGYMNATGSLNFSHYYGERQARTLGLETAQGLPSDTLMFGFLRGAARQYGRLTTQATSIWNRFGYNLWNDRATNGANGYGFGPNKGCSLSLHERLFFQSWSGGDSIVGTETGQFTGDRLENGAPELSPLGRQHLAIRQWSEAHPERGTLHTPFAFVLDFVSGWTVPRHLYRGDKYKVWGKLPYDKGDYLADQMFRMVWPGYEDASYLRNERGFVCDTPFGDSFDVLTNRCPSEVLAGYSGVMLLGDVGMPEGFAETLRAWVEAGGDLLLDAANAAKLAPELVGVSLSDPATAVATRSCVTGEVFAEQPYSYVRLGLVDADPLLLSESGDPIVTLHRQGAGRVFVCAADRWMTDALTYERPELVNMEPPYRLLEGVRALLSGYFASAAPVRVSPEGLNVRTCLFEDPTHAVVTLTNNDLFSDWEGEIAVRLGVPVRAMELRTGEELTPGPTLRLRVPAGGVRVIDLTLEDAATAPQ